MDRTKRLLAPAALAALAFPLGSCAPATAITVDVYTEVACSMNAEVSLTVAPTLAELAGGVPSSTNTGCSASGHVGSVVIAPDGDRGKRIAFAVATRTDNGSIDECSASPLPAACIVARRQLRFAPGDDLPMRIDLRNACKGVDCPEDQTCVNGVCVGADVTETCKEGCDETALATPTSCATTGATLIAAGVTGVVRAIATEGGVVAAWTSVEPGPAYAVRLQLLDEGGKPKGPPSDPIAAESEPIDDFVLGHDDTDFAIVLRRAGGTSFLRVSAEGGVLAGPTSIAMVDALNVHGLPWSGSTFGLSNQVTGGGPLAFTVLDPDGNTVATQSLTSSGTWTTTAWSGSHFGVGFRTLTDCYFARFDPDGVQDVAPKQIASSCYDAFITPCDNGWDIAFHTSNAPRRAQIMRLDLAGDTVLGPVDVSPPDEGEYKSAQLVRTASGANAVAFRQGVTLPAPVYWAAIGGDGNVTQEAAPIEGMSTLGFEMALLDDRVVVVSLQPDGVYSAILCPDAM